MVTALVPIAVFAGVTATVFFAFWSFWGSVNERANARVRGIADRLDRAGIKSGSQEIVLTVISGAAILWIVLLVVFHLPLLVSLILLPIIFLGARHGLLRLRELRGQAPAQGAFTSQLEPATRLLSGGLRVGLGLRQALAMVIEELPDPARYEFRRVIGQTNLGASVFDAFDDLADRMPSHECADAGARLSRPVGDRRRPRAHSRSACRHDQAPPPSARVSATRSPPRVA